MTEVVGGWSTYFLAWLGILAFLGTLSGIAHTRRDARRARTLDYLRRFNGEEFAPLNAKVLTFLATADPSVFAPKASHPEGAALATKDEVGKAFDDLDIETQAQVTLVLNFYEELSGSYRRGLLDENVAAEMIVPTVQYAWEVAKPFITYRREREAEWRPTEVAADLMRELEALYDEQGPLSQDLLDRLDGTPARLACVVALGSVFCGLLVLAADAATHDPPATVDSSLAAVAAVFAVLAAVALTPLLARSQSPRSLLLTGAITAALALSLTAGLTIALDLVSSTGPRGEEGKRGPAGPEGIRGATGRGGQKGERGKRGAGGSRGGEGKRGPAGPPGPRGPRGYPGSWDGS